MKLNLEKIKEKKSVKELLEFGILNIDKSSGPTSFNVSDCVRRKLKLRKTSHFGTLDPKVTGVLPIALNRTCKLTGFFLGEDKEYVGIMKMHSSISQKVLEGKIKEKFLGKITQLPPVKSRVKRAEREREIHSFEILEQKDKEFVFRVSCEGGTYIRKLIHDLGEDLGIGAHMLELRRIRAGIFLEKNSVNLYDFEKAVDEYLEGKEDSLKKIIIPGEIISELFPIVEVKKNSVQKLFTGKPIYHEDLAEEKEIERGEKICVFCKEKFVGIYSVIKGEDLFAKSEFVLQPIK